jgi:transcription elongation GreA/GreB family factor
VIKRNGQEVLFDGEKISTAIRKANAEVDEIHMLSEYQIRAVTDRISRKAREMSTAVNVEDIQDLVETGIMEMRGYEVAQKYVRYRYRRELARKSNTTDDGILALINRQNESRIQYLEKMLKTAKVISDKSKADEVGLNDTVTLYFEDDDEEEVYRLVTSIRGNSMEGRISIESPLGSAIRGHKEGETVFVKVNEKSGYEVTIRKIEKTGEEETDVIRSY